MQLTQLTAVACVIADDDSADVAMGNSASLLVTLANMGVQNNAVQSTARAAFVASAALTGALASLETILTATPFLAGAQPGISDTVVGSALYRSVAILGAAAVLVAAPHTVAWLAGIVGAHLSPAYEVVGTSLGGWKRIGGQVDRRPSPLRTAAAADAAIEINSAYKKKENQRQKERAAKKAEQASSVKDAAASGGAGSPAAGAAPPSERPFGVQPAASQRVENASGVPSLADGTARITGALAEWGVTFTGPHEHDAATDVRITGRTLTTYPPPHAIAGCQVH